MRGNYCEISRFLIKLLSKHFQYKGRVIKNQFFYSNFYSNIKIYNFGYRNTKKYVIDKWVKRVRKFSMNLKSGG